VLTFYPDNAKPQTPSVAIVAGCQVFIYRNLRPYNKFMLPSIDIHVRVMLVLLSLWCLLHMRTRLCVVD